MRLSRLLLLVTGCWLLASPARGQVYQPPDWVAEHIYHPIITCIVRIYEFCKNVHGGWKALLGRRRRSLDSPAGQICELQQPCLALQALDDGKFDQWVAESWPGAAGGWQSRPELSQLFGELTELKRAERPHSRQLRRRACAAVRRRCAAQAAPAS